MRKVRDPSPTPPIEDVAKRALDRHQQEILSLPPVAKKRDLWGTPAAQVFRVLVLGGLMFGAYVWTTEDIPTGADFDQVLAEPGGGQTTPIAGEAVETYGCSNVHASC